MIKGAKKILTLSSVDEDEKQLGMLYIVDVYARCQSHDGKQFGSFSQM